MLQVTHHYGDTTAPTTTIATAALAPTRETSRTDFKPNSGTTIENTAIWWQANSEVSINNGRTCYGHHQFGEHLSLQE